MKNLTCLILLGTLSAAPSLTIAIERTAALGTNAGASITTGDDNTLIGYDAGRYIDSEFGNVILGSQAGIGLLDTTGGQLIDFGALLISPYGGSQNVLIGYRAGWQSTSGFDNVFIGAEAGSFNTTAGDNTFVGTEAGENNSTGYDNTFIGEESGTTNTTGYENTFIGEDAGFSNSTGFRNTFVGNEAGLSADTGYLNTGIGNEALWDVDLGYLNTAVGGFAGLDIGDGVGNVFIGAHAGSNSEYADFNTIIGMFAGWENNRTNSLANANRNTYMGTGAAFENREGEDNVVMGAFAGGARWTDQTIGNFASATVWSSSPLIRPLTVNGSRRVVLGSQSIGNKDDTIAIGYYTESLGLRAIALGNNAQATHEDSIVIGYNGDSHGNDIIVLGNDDTLSVDPDADGVTALGSSSYRYSEVNAESFNAVADLSAGASVNLIADAGTNNDDIWTITANNSGDLSIESFASGAYTSIVSVSNNGDVVVAGDMSVNSDGRLKEQIAPIANPFGLLEEVVGKTYRWKAGTGRDEATHYGLIAQEVEAVVPELVSTNEVDGIKSVNYQGFVPILINAVSELKEQNRIQQEELRLLREQISVQQQLLEKLNVN